MNDNQLHNRVTNLARSRIRLPLHQQALKAQLLARHSAQQQSQNGPVSTFATIYKETLQIMRTKVKLVSLSGLAVMAVVAGLVLVMAPTPSSVSAAQAQLQATKTEGMQQLTPAEVARIERGTSMSLGDRLKQGLQAKDARIMSKAEFQKATGINPDGKLSTMAHITTYVTFTADDGQTIIGIDANDKPIMMMVHTDGGWTGPSQA